MDAMVMVKSLSIGVQLFAPMALIGCTICKYTGPALVLSCWFGAAHGSEVGAVRMLRREGAFSHLPSSGATYIDVMARVLIGG
jgi:hypothetical protein